MVSKRPSSLERVSLTHLTGMGGGTRYLTVTTDFLLCHLVANISTDDDHSCVLKYICRLKLCFILKKRTCVDFTESHYWLGKGTRYAKARNGSDQE